MQDDLQIRTATPADAAAIERITQEEFAPASIDARIERMIGGTPWHVIKAARVRQELESGPDLCAVAVLAGAVVGYVTTTIDPVASRGTIANLAVSAAAQGRGLGRRLIDWALAQFRARGLRQAKIETLEPNAVGRHLYPSLGFREVVRQIHYVMPLDPV